MCLKVFVAGSDSEYKRLKPTAMRLGTAFQKINFLRDLNADSSGLGRLYFPGKNIRHFSELDKKEIITDIKKDLVIAKPALRKLPVSSRFGVELAFKYFSALNNQMSKTPVQDLVNGRISLSKSQKIGIFTSVKIKKSLAS
jgi:hypothetical protein